MLPMHLPTRPTDTTRHLPGEREGGGDRGGAFDKAAVDPSGLDEPEQHVSAYGQVLIGQARANQPGSPTFIGAATRNGRSLIVAQMGSASGP